MNNVMKKWHEWKDLFRLDRFVQREYYPKVLVALAILTMSGLLLVNITRADHSAQLLAQWTIQHHQQNQRVLQQLTQIQQQLATLPRQLNNDPQLKTVLTDIYKEINAMQQVLLSMKNTTTKIPVNTLVPVSTASLPFQITSIDVIADTPFVMVNLDHQVLPMSVGDKLAGWQLQRVSYSRGEAQFDNSDHQSVTAKVTT